MARRASYKTSHGSDEDTKKLVKAVAAHVLDGEAAPPVLVKALNYKAWNVDILSLPEGVLSGVNMALNTYYPLKGYKSAGAQNKTAVWSRQNPEAWAFVSRVLEQRRHGDR